MGEIRQGQRKGKEEKVVLSKSSLGKTLGFSAVHSPSGNRPLAGVRLGSVSDGGQKVVGDHKVELRRYIREQKKQFGASLLTTMSEGICNKVLRSAWWQEVGTLLLYYPLPDEVDVRPLIQDAYKNSKHVLLPVCKDDELELHLYEGEDSLTPGAFGIMEPTGPLFPVEEYHKIQVALIPGMAFDRVGHRLGRGKGYYDRLLPRLTTARLQGICFPFQLLDEVPSEPHDIPVYEVIA